MLPGYNKIFMLVKFHTARLVFCILLEFGKPSLVPYIINMFGLTGNFMNVSHIDFSVGHLCGVCYGSTHLDALPFSHESLEIWGQSPY